VHSCAILIKNFPEVLSFQEGIALSV